LLAVVGLSYAEDTTLESLLAQMDTDMSGTINQKEMANALWLSPELAQTMMDKVSPGDDEITMNDVTSFLQRDDVDTQRLLNGLSFLVRLKHVNDHQLLNDRQWASRQASLTRAKRYNHMMEQAPASAASLLQQKQTSLQRVLMEKSGQSDPGAAGSSLAEGSPPAEKTDATVTACGSGQWSDTGSTPCAPCSSCDTGEVTLMQCSASANTVCKKCEDGNCCDIKTRTFWTDGTSCGRIVGAPAFMDTNAKTELTVNGVCQSGTCILTATQN